MTTNISTVVIEVDGQLETIPRSSRSDVSGVSAGSFVECVPHRKQLETTGCCVPVTGFVGRSVNDVEYMCIKNY